MKPLSRVSNNRALLVLSALGFLCASSGLVAAQVMGPGDVGTGSGGKKVGNVYYIGTPNGPVRKTQSLKSGPVKNAPVQGRIGGLAVDPSDPSGNTVRKNGAGGPVQDMVHIRAVPEGGGIGLKAKGK